MDIVISPGELRGRVPAIASKSDAHRCLILAALAAGQTQLRFNQSSEDIDATMACLAALGAEIKPDAGGVSIGPIQPQGTPVLDCGESGSTLRFLLPVAAAASPSAAFTGGGRLPQRPLGPLKAAMEAHGVTFSSPSLPFTIQGQLTPGVFTLAGDESSQYISGLLMACAALGQPCEMRLTSPLQSAGYVDMTIHALARFGIAVTREEQGYTLAGCMPIQTPGTVEVEGDWSNAAFFLCAGALSGSVTVQGLNPLSLQRDKAVVDCLKAFGARVEVAGQAVTVSRGELRGCEIDAGHIPDLVPPLAVVAALSRGETVFTNAGRLRLKESDRIASVCAMLAAFGVRTAQTADTLRILGRDTLVGNTVDSAGDHRIAMAAAIAGAHAKGETRILGAQAVNKSYPGFFEDFEQIGGNRHVVHLR